MRLNSGWYVAIAVAAFGLVNACTCGPGGAGSSCTTTDDCGAGLQCLDQICNVPGGGGGDGGDAGDGGGTDAGDAGDAGDASVPDAACQGLECQQVRCQDGGTTTLIGSVYDPAGRVPLYNAIVYVPRDPNPTLAPFTSGPTCEACGATVSGNPVAIALTSSDGGFVLKNVPVGNNIPLVVQLGRWRRLTTIPAVPQCQTTPITDANLTRLPRTQAEGDIPKMAIATGSIDRFECLLRKVGIADTEITLPDAGGRVHFYKQNGLNHKSGTPPAGTALFNDAATLNQYDVVILPCASSASNNTSGATTQGFQNIVDYASSGGRLFLTHYAYGWVTSAPTSSGWLTTAAWTPDPGNNHMPNTNPFTFTADTSFPKGQAFAEWLQNVNATTTFGQLSVTDPRNDIASIDGGPGRQWLYALQFAAADNTTRDAVEHMTWNTPLNPPPLPDGDAGVQCGRVLFSDFHVTANAHDAGASNTAPFPDWCNNDPPTAQEKALEFMLFDLSACVQDDATAPQLCSLSGETCQTTANCCGGSGLQCLDNATGLACAGGTCSCQVIIGAKDRGESSTW